MEVEKELYKFANQAN